MNRYKNQIISLNTIHRWRMKLVKNSKAKIKLADLINHAILGQDVTITRDGIPVAKIVPIEPPKKKIDLEKMRALTAKMKLYPRSFVEDMRAAGEL